MTTQKSFKRLVRARMEKTGQSHTTARAAPLSAAEPPQATERGVFTVCGGEQRDGFAISATKTVAAHFGRLYDALRERWLSDGRLRERTDTRPTSARYDWDDGSMRLIVGLLDKGEAKSTIALSDERSADPARAERLRAFWRQRLEASKELLERA